MAVYAQTLLFSFTYSDDNTLILDNRLTLGSPAGIARIFSDNVYFGISSTPYYRPVLNLTLWADTMAGSFRPAVYHFSNIVFHIISSCLLLVLLSRFGMDRTRAFFFTAVFAVHPVLSQAVAWIPGRNDSLLAIFAFSAFIFFLDHRKSGKMLSLAAYAVLLFLALLTKETAIAVVVMTAAYIALNRDGANIWKPYLAVWAMVLPAWFFLRQAMLWQASDISYFEVARFMLSNIPGLLLYLGKIFVPYNLSVMPLLRNSSLTAGWICLMVLTVLLLLSKNKDNRMVAFGAVWSVVFLLPAIYSNEILEHRLYTAIPGIFILLSQTDLVSGASRKRLTAVLAAILLLFIPVNLVHSRAFSSPIAFWESASRTSPDFAKVRRNLGVIYYRSGKIDLAEKEYMRAYDINPNEPGIYNSLGNLYLSRGETARAAELYAEELDNNPAFVPALENLSCHYINESRYAEAAKLWEKALSYAKRPPLFSGLGEIQLKLGMRQAAKENFLKEISADPFSVRAYTGLGHYYLLSGDLEQAKAAFNKALSIDPGYEPARTLLDRCSIPGN